MKEKGVAVGPFRRKDPVEEPERIEEGRFKVGPERDAPEDVRVPEGDGMVPVDFVIEKLLHGEIERNKIGSEEPLPAENDIPEKKQANRCKKETAEDVFSICRHVHLDS